MTNANARSAANSLRAQLAPSPPEPTTYAQQIADELIEYLNEWHSQPEAWDNDLDAQIHRWYADAPNIKPKFPYFSPSSANACARELYHKAKYGKKDKFKIPPYQGRWQRIGTAIGDVIQRDILFMEKHFEKLVGRPCPFSFERNKDGTPMFEDFAKKNHLVTHNGQSFHLFGTCDGIMRYVTEDGEVLRVGLEIKSKQTSAARTSYYSLKKPDEKHVKQCYSYAVMYDVDLYVILYVNGSKKAWEYDEGEFEKSPDIRAFGLEIGESEINSVLDRFADIQASINAGKPPELDLNGWTFNGYKTECAKSLTDAELEEIRDKVSRVMRSNVYPSTKQQYAGALEFIEKVRKGEAV
ncbi:hypothetical protein [Bacillus subtilis]|uniref:hypothetical protein n=2 Tax=Bacillus subtilis TaxID=1423 RepID=UPI002DBF8CF3|nr:hypothetical protein [Bacillus subtilis]MEC0429318.1 hypothetical protein [Bacillus subtilis]